MGPPPKPAKDPTPRCESKQGNPIDSASGTKYQEELDVELPGRNMTIKRVYTNAVVERIFRFSHERNINGDLNVPSVTRPSSGVEDFTAQGSSFVPDTGINARLTRLTNAGVTVGWVYVSANDEIEEYDARGLLTAITHRSGEKVTLAYASLPFSSVTSSFPQSITHRSGRVITFTYDQSNNITSATLPNGATISYTYGSANLLSKVTYPELTERRYLFNEPANTANTNIPFALTGIVDERQIRQATFKYDSNGQAVSTEYAGGVNKYSVAYTTPGGSHSITDPLGSVYTQGLGTVANENRVTSSTQPAGAGCAAASSSRQLDANGNVSTSIDQLGRTTTFTYDLTRNLETQRVEASGTSIARTVSSQWHPDWRVASRIAEPLKITTFVYNGQPDPTNANAVLTCVAPGTPLLPNGKVVGVLCKQVEQATTDASGSLGFSATSSGSPRVQSWTYNTAGQALTYNGPRVDLPTAAEDVTQYAYYTDTQANWRISDLKSITRPGGHVTQFTKYDGDGRLLESIDPNGTTTTLTYAPRGWLTKVEVIPSGATVGLVTMTDYDPSGRVLKVTQPNGSFTARTYDDAG